jgi:uncharacterized RDD family membrane protein YckC
MNHSPYSTRFAPRQFAGVPFKRGLAWVFDIVFIALICMLVLAFTAFIGIFFYPFLMLVVGFVYRWFTIAGGSATWGMRMNGIVLCDVGGAPLSSGLALAHTFGYSLSVAIPPLQVISVVLILVSARGQGLTDLVLGTTAINLRS